MKWIDISGCVKAEVICQKHRTCKGDQTYNEDLSSNGFLGQGEKIEVIEVRSQIHNRLGGSNNGT